MGGVRHLILNTMRTYYLDEIYNNDGAGTNQYLVSCRTSDSSMGSVSTVSLDLDLTGIAPGTQAAVDAAKTRIIAFAYDHYSETVVAGDIILGAGILVLLGLLPTTAIAESALSLSVQTSTGAVGTQVSSTHDSYVMVNTSVSTTATIAGNAAGDLVLEVAPTNSATAGDWVERGRNGNSQTLTLALTLQSVQLVKGQMVAFVPKGYYVKVRSVTGSGSPTYIIVSARKVLI